MDLGCKLLNKLQFFTFSICEAMPPPLLNEDDVDENCWKIACLTLKNELYFIWNIYIAYVLFLLYLKLYCTPSIIRFFFRDFFFFVFIHFIDLWKKSLREKRQKSNINKWGNMQRIISEYDTDEKRFIQKVKTPSKGVVFKKYVESCCK